MSGLRKALVAAVAVLVMSAAFVVSPTATQEAVADECQTLEILELCLDPILVPIADLVVDTLELAVPELLAVVEAGLEPIVTPLLEPFQTALEEELAAIMEDPGALCNGLYVFADTINGEFGHAFDPSKPGTLFRYKAVTEVPARLVAELIPEQAPSIKKDWQSKAAFAEACALLREGEVEDFDNAEHEEKFQETITLISDEHEATRMKVMNEHDSTRTKVMDEHDSTRTKVFDEHELTRATVEATAMETQVHVTNETDGVEEHVTNEIAAEHDFRVLMDIHKALSAHHEARNVLLMLPAEGPDAQPNGLLELVRQVVDETLAQLRAVGHDIRSIADREFESGNAAYDGGDYVKAYDHYKKAYLEASKP